MIKKWIAILCTLLIALQGVSVCSFAETESAGEEQKQQVVEKQAESWRYHNGYNILDEQAPAQDSIEETRDVKGQGIDVSYWQYNIDWKAVKDSGIEFAILRCGYGSDKKENDDSTWEKNAAACEELGIPYGVYLYSYATSEADVQSEINHTLRKLEGYDPTYPVYYDLEDAKTVEKQGRAKIIKFADMWCSAIEEAGYDAGIYANLNWFNNYLNDSSLDKYEHWVAQYYSSCSYKGEYGVWQYTSTGSVPGIQVDVDMNYNYYDRDFGAERISGHDRVETSINLAESYRETSGKDKFSSIVLATGNSYPDSLSGGCLAIRREAPVVLTNSASKKAVINYVKNHLENNGEVVILGGTSAVPASYDKDLKAAGFTVNRYNGADRYETNLEILKDDSVEDSDELLICTGKNYPDSVSASSLNIPIMLVDKQLSKEQIEYLEEHVKTSKYSNIYICGGESAVNAGIEESVKEYCVSDNQVIRIAGDDRYQTSQKIAEMFYKGNIENAILTTGQNYPDGLASSTLSYVRKAPILLVSNKDFGYAKAYCDSKDINDLIVIGGNAAVSSMTVKKLFK